MEHVYLDNAATTPMAPEVITEMTTQMQNDFGNASSTHWFGRQAHTVMDQSRLILANSINAKPNDIIITSGATESNNTALMQTAHTRQNLGKHIITTAIEHPSILRPLEALEAEGFRVTYLPVNDQGVIDLADFDAALDDDTILVTIMFGNNEVGSRMPIEAIGERLINHQAWFHTDATQAYGLLDIDVQAMHIDMLSVSAHKINGPKQIGFLYRGPKIYFPSFIRGGEQEMKRRAGTESVVQVAGFAKAVSLITPEVKAERQARYFAFKQQLMARLNAADIEFAVNGSLNPDNLNHVFNLWFKGISTYALQTNLDLAGFAISGGSACTAGSLEPSHVLTAMFGEASPRIGESIRTSFGHETTAEQIDAYADALIRIINRIKTKANA
ncbi:cysteine desulfurase family protein [Lacticaseibacillus brantae]|uniref:Cysteine sulfinate desulfinase cysteine desulfurase related enzyme n=1 Tax=Lacticaseibacillus brantae DSM 23927 TaxID=1423727 RepID=A0A0R2B9Z2_9LACO|nr:cysteine desulfurase family protein [Lacticaseibacillus brantae]KRM72524.1 Cysteine sulfinate desulfinase cysteine desulfurase related enzyme [Lacticaseibacillus brantae DSM 23927]